MARIKHRSRIPGKRQHLSRLIVADEDTVYVPVTVALLPDLADWSEPVQLKVEPHRSRNPLLRELTVRRVDLDEHIAKLRVLDAGEVELSEAAA